MSIRGGLIWLAYPLLGICFGITLTQSEVVSWFRFQEMFRFQSPRMYEIMASAIAVGGAIFGLGWALSGACPGPLFALVGNGVTVMIVAIASALAGTWLYGFLRPRLPH